MANILEYTLSLQDKVSANLKKIGVNSDEALNVFAKLEGQSKTVSKTLNAMGTSVYTLKQKIDLLKQEKDLLPPSALSAIRQYNREIDKLEKQVSRLEKGIGSGIGGKMKEWRQDFAANLPGAGLIKNPLTIAGAAFGGIWTATSAAMDADKEKMKMQVLTGSQEIGGALYNGLTKFATDTVFGSEVYDMGAQMLANGIKTGDVMPVMKELGDISMGQADKLGQLSLAFAQINGKGHLAGQELLQLINAGFNPLQVISEKTGESYESLTKKMEKGQISIDDVRKAMETATGPGGKFNGMLDKIAKTPYGQMQNLIGTFDQMKVKIGQAFLPIASRVMIFFSWIGEKLGPYLQPIVVVLAALAAGILIVAAAQWVWNAAQLANPTTWIVLGIIALIAVILYVVSLFDGWGAAWGHLMDFLKYSWEYFKSGWVLSWLSLQDGFLKGIELIQTAWYNLQSLWDEEGANAGLAKIEAQQNERANEIAETKSQAAIEAVAAATAASKIVGKNGLKLGDKKEGNSESLLASLVPKPPKGKGDVADDVKKSNNAIATGGTKNTTINVHIGKQIEHFTLMTNSLKEGTAKLKEIIVDEMTRAFAMSQSMGQ